MQRYFGDLQGQGVASATNHNSFYNYSGVVSLSLILTMSSVESPFIIKEHVVEAQHVREYPHATAHSQDEVLYLAVKQYIPKNNLNPQPGDITIIASHANGFVKVRLPFTVYLTSTLSLCITNSPSLTPNLRNYTSPYGRTSSTSSPKRASRSGASGSPTSPGKATAPSSTRPTWATTRPGSTTRATFCT